MKTNSSTYRNKPGFEVPEGYFNQLDQNLLSSVMNASKNLEAELKTGFEVPPNYFNTLEGRLIEISNLSKKGKAVSLFSKKQILYVAGIAAVLIAFISTILLKPVSASLNNVEISAIEEYIDEGNVDFNFNEVSSYMFDESYIVDNIETKSYNAEAILEYLNENVEDPTLIME